MSAASSNVAASLADKFSAQEARRGQLIWDMTQKKLPFWQEEFKTFFAEYTKDLRKVYADPAAKSHIKQLRESMLKGAAHLNKGQSTIVLLEPKVFGPENEPVEPIEGLLKQCKHLVIAGSNEETLNILMEKFGDTKKVTSHVVDWTGKLGENLLRFVAAPVSVTKIPSAVTLQFLQYLSKIVAERSHAVIMAANVATYAKKILGAEKGVDYVISSIVPFETLGLINRTINFLYERLCNPVEFAVISKEAMILKIKENGFQDLLKRFPQYSKIEDDLNELYSTITASQWDLAFSIVRPNSGQVYVAEITKVLKHNDGKSDRLDGFAKRHLKKINCEQHTKSWVWKTGTATYEIGNWVLSKIPKGSLFLPKDFYDNCNKLVLDQEKGAADEKAASAATSSAITSTASPATASAAATPSTASAATVPAASETTSKGTTNLDGVD